LIGILVNIYGVHSITNFKVIEIVDDSKPYPTLMGVEWAFEIQTIINLKRRETVFEVGDLKFTAPLDSIEGMRYIEPARGKKIDNLYNMIALMDDYVNPIAHGALSWRRISSCALESKEVMGHLKQRMHEVCTK
jgi:hypothetical protein